MQLWAFSVADQTVGSFITFEPLYSYWNRPLLRDLVLLPMPIAVFYGETDQVIPSHNGVGLASFADGNVPCYIFESEYG